MKSIKLKLSSIALFACAILSFSLVSCDKQPIGPTEPDPLGPPDPSRYITLVDFRALYTGGGVDQNIPAGTKKIRAEVVSNTINEASRVYRLQDESGGGLYLFAASGSPVYAQGTVLEIDAASSGVHTIFNGDLELKNVPQAKVVQLSGSLSLAIREATIADIIANNNTWSSSLVRIKNVISIVQASTNSAGVTYNITDATGVLSTFVRNTSGITVNTSGTTVTGYVSIFNSATQVGIRTVDDIQ